MVFRKEDEMMLRHWRLLLLMIMVCASLFAIFLKPQYTGVQIAYVHSESPAKGVLQTGAIISEVNEKVIHNTDEWNNFFKNYTGEVKIKSGGKDYKFFVNETGIGIEVVNLDRLNLDFGLDIKGGTRIVLKPKGNVTSQTMEQILGTLQTRANIYGLQEIRFFSVRGMEGDYYVQIEATGLGREIVDTLLSKQGNFEAKIIKPVYLRDGKGIFDLGENKYEVEYAGENTIKLSNMSLKINDTFVIDDITFEFVNITQTGDLIFLGKAYEGSDIELVYTDAQHSGIIPQRNYFEFYFGVLVSEKGAQRFAKITSGIPSQLDLDSGESYLKDSRIILYLDGQPVSDLRIASSLGGKAYTTPQITGGRETREEALEEKLRLQTILRSGALPVSLETVSVGVITPTLGEGFILSAIIAGGIAAIIVALIIFLRYRKLSVALPMILIGFSEVVIILGIAANHDWFIWCSALVLNFILLILVWWKKYETDFTSWIGALLIPLLGLLTWSIDLPVIGGIIATLGVGVDSMIIIADQTGKKEEKMIYSIREKIKAAFFIIFGSASTTISAMVPLMVLGIGFVRGFAITTIIGVLVGILITRPAYAEIVQMGTSKEKSEK
jgi:preprotein translocase subunit SecD